MKDTLIRRRVYGDKKSKSVDYRLKYFTITVLDAPVTISGFAGDVYYSIDDGNTWTLLRVGSSATLSTGTVSLWKGSLIPDNSTYHFGIGTVNVQAVTYGTIYHISVSGNPFSLIHGDNFIEKTEGFFFYSQSQFSKLFFDCSALLDAQNLWFSTGKKFSGSIASDYCCYQMFSGCSSLLTAPTYLPDISFDENAYHAFDQMFSGCQNLLTAPMAISIYLGYNCCCRSMFEYCISLKTAPTISVLVNGDGTYSNMFELMFVQCEKLNSVTCYFSYDQAYPPESTDIQSSWMPNWLKLVGKNGTFVTNRDMNWVTIGDSGIPKTWTVEYIEDQTV